MNNRRDDHTKGYPDDPRPANNAIDGNSLFEMIDTELLGFSHRRFRLG